AAGLREVGTTAALAADERRDLAHELAGGEALREVLAHGAHEQRAAVLRRGAEQDDGRRELVAQLVRQLAQRTGVAELDGRAEHVRAADLLRVGGEVPAAGARDELALERVELVVALLDLAEELLGTHVCLHRTRRLEQLGGLAELALELAHEADRVRAGRGLD